MNKNIIITGIMTIATLGIAFGAYQQSNKINEIKSEISATNDRAAALNVQKQTASNVTHADHSSAGVEIVDNRESAYKGNSQTAIIVDAIKDSLTYNSGDALKETYAKHKGFLTGSIWKDLYGTVKSTGDPAINQFAAQIDNAKKTGSVKDDIQLVSMGGKYYVTLTAHQGGDASAGAVNGSNIYEFEATPKGEGFDVKLLHKLVNIDT